MGSSCACPSPSPPRPWASAPRVSSSHPSSQLRPKQPTQTNTQRPPMPPCHLGGHSPGLLTLGVSGSTPRLDAPCLLAPSCPNHSLFWLALLPSLADSTRRSSSTPRWSLSGAPKPSGSLLSWSRFSVQASGWHMSLPCGHLGAWATSSSLGASPGQNRVTVIYQCVLRAQPEACPTDSGWSTSVYWGLLTSKRIVFYHVHKSSFTYLFLYLGPLGRFQFFFTV